MMLKLRLMNIYVNSLNISKIKYHKTLDKPNIEKTLIF